MMVANRVIALIWYQVAGDLALYLVKRVVVWDIGGVGGWWWGGCFCVLVLWKSVVAECCCSMQFYSVCAAGAWSNVFLMSQVLGSQGDIAYLLMHVF